MKAIGLVLGAAQVAARPGDVAANVARHLRFCRLAAEHGVQLLVFPELSAIGYELALARENALRPDSPALRPLREFAAEARMTVVVGAPLLNEADQLHIAAFAYGVDGRAVTYTKVHVHSSEEPVFTSGPGGYALRVGDSSVALAICADASHSSHAAKAAVSGAHVYAVGAMIDEPDYDRKSALLQGYAAQHGMAVLLANYSGSSGGQISAGRSAIWSEDGSMVAGSRGNEEALVIGSRVAGAWEGAVLLV